MGCRTSKDKESDYTQQLKEKIDHDRFTIANFSNQININDKCIQIDQIGFNPLAYSLYKGKYKSFRYIHEILNASIKVMEDLLISQGMNPLALCCSHGELNLFKYYFNLSSCTSRTSIILSEDLNTKKTDLNKDDLLIIQQAVLQGFIHIVDYLHTLAPTLNNIPDYINIHYIDPLTGENCALVACRSGNFAMIKYIYNIGGDFQILNRKNQNAVQVLAYSTQKSKNFDVCECFKFLILEVKVQYFNEYEDILMNICDEPTVCFFEKTLEKCGVYVTKKEIEMIFKSDSLRYRASKNSENDKLSFLSFTSQASVFGTLNQKDNV